MSEEIKIFRRATLASVITSTYPMIVVGCYFGVTPWIFNRLSIDESDFSFAILLFGIFFIISNQIAGRILVPKYGTKLIMSLAFPLVTFSTFLAIISSSPLNMAHLTEKDLDETGWIARVDPSRGKIFYYNTQTKESTWEEPVALKVRREVRRFMGTS